MTDDNDSNHELAASEQIGQILTLHLMGHTSRAIARRLAIATKRVNAVLKNNADEIPSVQKQLQRQASGAVHTLIEKSVRDLTAKIETGECNPETLRKLIESAGLTDAYRDTVFNNRKSDETRADKLEEVTVVFETFGLDPDLDGQEIEGGPYKMRYSTAEENAQRAQRRETVNGNQDDWQNSA